MATVGLAVVGNLIAPGIGGALGAALGGYIDNAFIFPAIFDADVPVQEGPRLDQLRLQSASEGAPILRCYGPQNRVAGTILWVSPVREVKTQEEVGSGKGTGKPAGVTITYTYYLDIAVGICQGPISKVSKIKGDDRVIYTAQQTVSVTGTDISGTNLPYRENYTAALEVPANGTDLSVFLSEVPATISGFATGSNNGAWDITWAGKAVPGNTFAYIRRASAPAFSDEAAGPSVTVSQVQPEQIGRADDVTIYLGNDTQVADSTIASHEADVPAWRGLAYVVIDNLNISDFGNRIPNFNFFVEADAGGDPPVTSYTVGDCISDIMDRARLSEVSYDVSTLTEELRGYVIPGPQPLIQQLEPLMLAFDIAAYEDGDTITFVKRSATDISDFDEIDFGAAEGDAEPEVRDLLQEQTSGLNLPHEITLEYGDPEISLQQGAARERVINSPVDVTDNIRLAMTLTSSEARAIAQRQLWRPYSERTQVHFMLPPSYTYLKENDRLILTYEGETYNTRIVEINRGANGILQCRGIVEIDVTTDTAPSVDSSASPAADADKAYQALTVTLEIMDIAPLRTADTQTPGYYFVISLEDQTAEFLGGTLFDSTDDSAFDQVANFPPEATMGVTITALDDATTTTEIDSTSTVEVELNEGSLSSVTRAQLLQGGVNICLIGDEICAFESATLIATNQYELQGFIRGQRNTEDHATGHAIGERFVLLNGLVGFVSIATAQIGANRYFRPVAAFGDINAVTSQQKVLEGQTLKPFSPANVQGSRSGTDITISWDRRSRDLVRFLSTTTPPLLDSPETYEVDILTAPLPGGTVLRTKTVVGGTSTTYTTAEQTTDGLTPGDPVDVAVYQISPVVGRGNVKEANV